MIFLYLQCSKKCLTKTVPQKVSENIPYCEIDIAEKYYKNLKQTNPVDSKGNNLIDLGASELKQFYDTATVSLMGQYLELNIEKIAMQHYLDYNCSQYWANEVLKNNMSTGCPPTCETLEYHGKIIKDEDFNCFEKPNNLATAAGISDSGKMECKWMDVSYEFASPEYVKTYEEYLICDGKTMIGNVGGTFGMFIGFSFSNVISNLIEIFQRFGNRRMF